MEQSARSMQNILFSRHGKEKATWKRVAVVLWLDEVLVSFDPQQASGGLIF